MAKFALRGLAQSMTRELPQTANSLSKTTEIDTDFDVLSDLLRSMRISGSTLLDDEYVMPWAIAIPTAAELAKLLRVSLGIQVVAFHFVKRGYIEITQPDGTRTIVEAGEIAICFGGEAHQISQGVSSQLLSVATLLAGGENLFRPDCQHSRNVALICGVFLLHHTELNPLFGSLPPVLHLSAHRARGLHQLSIIGDLLIREVDTPLWGSGYAIERLLELLCAEAVRSYLETIPTHGWFRGLQDPIVGKAIVMIHASPDRDWTVASLAQAVAISPSRFAARFVAALGQSPMMYAAKWRMNLASRLLVQTKLGIEPIALAVGYTSLPAFHRAFKKHLGLPPAAWRNRHLGDSR
jgi:AraC-like DNA-binding protein